MRLLALGTVVALLTYGAVEAVAATRPDVPELPAGIAFDEAPDVTASPETAPRASEIPRDPRARAASRWHPAEPREHAAPTLGAWHPTGHARDDSPDH